MMCSLFEEGNKCAETTARQHPEGRALWLWYPQLETGSEHLTAGLRPALSCLIDMASIPLLLLGI